MRRLWWAPGGGHDMYWRAAGLVRRARYWWRPSGVVLWGGRVGGLGLIDRQFGSHRDLHVARLEVQRAARLLAMRRFHVSASEMMLRATISLRDSFTPAVRQAEEAMRKMAEAVNRAGKAGATGRMLFPPEV